MREGSGDKVIAFVDQHPTILDVSRMKEKGASKYLTSRNMNDYRCSADNMFLNWFSR
jgi:hypothetical protein